MVRLAFFTAAAALAASLGLHAQEKAQPAGDSKTLVYRISRKWKTAGP